MSQTAEDLVARAIDANAPIEVLDRLIAVRDKIAQEHARRAFFNALAIFQSGLPTIPKNRVAKVVTDRSTYEYRYADLAAIQAAIAPLMKEVGLSVSFDSELNGERYTIRCTVHHKEGYSQTSTVTIPIDARARMNEVQRAGSALTYGKRYALCAALGIVTAEEDDDALSFSLERGKEVRKPLPAKENGGNGQAGITEAQHRLLEAKIQELGLDREWVKARIRRVWGVEHLTDLPQDRFQDLLGRLPTWAEAVKAKKANGNGRDGNGQEPIVVTQPAVAKPDPVAGLVEKLLARAKEVRHQAGFADSSQARMADEKQAQEIEILAGRIEELSGQPRQLLGRALSGKHSSLEAARLRAEELADEEKAVVLEALEWAKVFQAHAEVAS